MTFSNIQTRREMLRLALAGVACFAASPAMAAIPKPSGMRHLALHNLHTDERISLTYWKDGRYDRAVLSKLNYLMRDYRTGDVYPINPRLYDLIHDLQHKMGNDRAVEIVSAYRSPATNRMLARMSDGVAKNSYHLRGMAVDLRLSGASLGKLHKTALAMHRGGVGYYPSSDFVHVDVGPVRRW